MSWLWWAVILLLQNASFTLVSRARNSGSLKYHMLAAIGSNGIWFVGLMFAVDKIKEARATHNTLLLVGTALFYTIFTVIGSVAMHYISMKYIEKGKRKVGA